MSGGQPRLSVIVVSYECRALVEGCLESLQRERESFPLEVILVDNHSSDGTPAAVAERFPWVRLIAAPTNLGFAKASNLGIERAEGTHLLFLNPDTEVPPGTLAAAVEELERNPDVGMLGVKLVKPDGSLDHAAKRGFPTPLSALYYFTGLARLKPQSERYAQYTAGHVDPDETARVDAINGAFMLVRREALRDVGGLDEDYWLYMEDLDWCLRFWKAGWPVLYWPEARVFHVKGGSSHPFRAWKEIRAFHRGMWLFYSKHYRSERSPMTTMAVWLGINLRLAVSAVRSYASRALRRPPDKPPLYRGSVSENTKSS